jgi:hypothetical protein
MTHIAGNRRQGDPGQLGPWKEILELDRFFTLEKPSIRFIQYFVYNMTYTEVVANNRAIEDRAIARQNTLQKPQQGRHHSEL